MTLSASIFRHLTALLCISIGFALSGCGSSHTTLPKSPKKIAYEILAVYPHDTNTFTQGLVINGDVITETSGLYAKSFLVQYNALSNEILRGQILPRDIFAEGITELNGRFYVLTWHAEKAFVFNAQTLVQEQTLTYTGEGWGITHDGEHLITSDGSNVISFRTPEDFSVVKTLQVGDGTRTWNQLNELEFAEQRIWANVWQTPLLLAINPASGQVEAIVDMAELDRINNHMPGHSVLNGIAYDPERQAYWITGKLWPNRYLVRFNWPPQKP